MARRVLDTNKLISWWRRKGGEGPIDQIRGKVEEWASELLEIEDAAGILSPVFLEFVCHFNEAARLKIGEQFIRAFEVKDNWHVVDSDLQEALRIARRIPRDRKPRQFADCLIRAIATRLRYDVSTTDRGFPN